MPFLLDSNIFIEPKNRMPMDLYPTFWNKFYTLILGGNIFSITKVKSEIERGSEKDELTEWIKKLPDNFFIPLSVGILDKYGETITWANSSNHYTQTAKAKYADIDSADAFLISTAAYCNYTLVTHETSDLRCTGRIKIPDAAKEMNVNCCTFNNMLRTLHFTI